MRSIFTLPALLAIMVTLVSVFTTGVAGRIVADESHQLARVKRHLVARAELVQQPICTDPATKLNSHDCNVALLSTGTGIAGKIQFLRVAGTKTVGTNGTCSITVEAVDGGTAISISKGRFEQAFKSFVAVCGVSPGTVVAAGGSVGGNTKITVSAA